MTPEVPPKSWEAEGGMGLTAFSQPYREVGSQTPSPDLAGERLCAETGKARGAPGGRGGRGSGFLVVLKHAGGARKGLPQPEDPGKTLSGSELWVIFNPGSGCRQHLPCSLNSSGRQPLMLARAGRRA